VGFGAVRATPKTWQERVSFSIWHRAQWNQVQRFLATHDDRVLLDASPDTLPIEKVDVAHLVQLLRNPQLLAILPSSLTGKPATTSAPLSEISEFILGQGAWLEGLGIVLLVLPVALLPRRHEDKSEVGEAV